MNIFKHFVNKKIQKEVKDKKKEQEGEVIVKDFKRRIPFWGYRPVNYKITEQFRDYKTEIDAYLEKLFKGEIDSGNADILDNMIIDCARQAEKDLVNQHSEHRDSIKSFDVRAASDKRAFELHLEQIRLRLMENRERQKKYLQLLDDDEFLRRTENEKKEGR